MRKIITSVFFSLAVLVTGILWFNSKPQESKKEKKPLTAYEKYAIEKIKKKKEGHAKADAPEMNGIIERELRTKIGADGPEYSPNQVMEEFIKAKARASQARTATDEFDFIERGPGNVAGRTRALLIDPDDTSGQTWFAGSASGGIWKTTDGGGNWAFISGDIPNLGTNTLVMSEANPQVIYAGTGEHFTNDIDGAGIFKSTDKGATWTQVVGPSDFPDLKNVSRLAIDPNDENTVIATTRNGRWEGSLQAAIYKTTDGGTTWTNLRSSSSERYDDIAVSPTDFNTVYVAIQGIGVIKSTDGGATWSQGTGMSPGGRVEIAISPVNANRLWASVEGGVSGSGSDLYVSSDGAATWNIVINSNGNNEDFLGGQGWYDNYATAHPFDEDIVYVGGVNNWKFELGSGDVAASEALETAQNGTQAFMTYIDFGGAYLGGGMDLGSVAFESLRDIEVRFGVGTQMAHRFTVGGEGPGVPASGYFYEDYVPVPFQVWDTKNDVQLMVSFRDQQEDGAWNLIEANTAGATADQSREYFYVHNMPYSATANSSIAQDGGIDAEQMYFFWPVLTGGASFDPNNLPTSNLAVFKSTLLGIERITTNISDAYNDFSGRNNFPQAGRDRGIHPDQHNNVIVDIDEENQTFRMMNTNDGGVYRSVSSTDPGVNDGDFTYVSYGYNTTQFYGADKAPGENRFIGGMQDNGTWYHAEGVEGAADAQSTFGIGGDGFEALWHGSDVNKMIGGSQFNGFAKTTNGGQSWTGASTGLTGSGPFRTRLSHHKQLPDRIHAVTSTGIWRSEDFGGVWGSGALSESDFWTSAFTNSTDVEVSYADPDVIWAGAQLSSSGRPFVSTDGGRTYSPAENYTEEMGSIAGIGTHPFDNETAYLLFSFSDSPKVLRTTDLGQTWTDISGFDGSGDRGFPDVAINSIFVFPTDPDRIWVGSEIGIIESLDNGDSWALLQSNMPAVNIHDFKLVENQLVIATYGRGIWSVQLDGIVTAPSFKSAFTAPNGDINLNVNFIDQFDSTEIYVNSNLVGTVYDNAVGTVSEKINDSGINGNVLVKLDAYVNGNRFSSLEIETFILGVKDVEPSYSTKFEDAEDFAGYGLTILKAPGYSDKALHSEHNYVDGVEAIYYLRTPVTVASSDAFLKYKDIAIIETGEEGAVYPEESFYDYVVVEASTDGQTWIALEDGYDASLHSEWESAYNNEEGGEPGMFKEHSINLLDKFSAGDDILVRFRLFADAGANAYGWVVDDLLIQQELPLSTNVENENAVSVFPNPIVNSAEIQLNVEALESNIRVYSAGGKLVDRIQLEENQKSVTWTPSNLGTGVYILRFISNNGPISKKLFIK
ncbi:MAG: T9SS type A sorting domain-containing protein [Ekhidna sp.]